MDYDGSGGADFDAGEPLRCSRVSRRRTVQGGKTPEWIPGGREASGFYAGFIGAFIVSLWMGHPRKKLAWLSGLLAVTLATFGCGLLFLRDSSPPFGDNAPQFTGFLGLVALYQTFQCLAAIGLGVRLWSDAAEETKKAPKFGAEGD